MKLYHSMGMATGNRGAWTYVKGAMGAVTQALARVATARGAVIRTGAEVRQILIRDGRATGAVLADGEEIRGRVVLSNADPVRTYLGLVPGRELPDDYRRAVEAIKIESPVMKINMAITEPPRFSMLPPERVREGYSGGLFIAPSIDYMQRACDEARAGRPAAHPFLNVHLQSAVDDSVAPRRPPHPVDLHPVLSVPAGGGDLGRAARRDRRPGAGGARPLRAERARLGARATGPRARRISRPASG